MAKFLPDCGVLNSPSSSAGQSSITTLSLPKLLNVTNGEPAAKLGAGLSVCFYKSPKAGPSRTPTASPSPSQFSRPAKGRRPGGAINKGVGHGIKKPKMKAKDKKASNPAKVSVRRLKQVKPPPRLAEHRSPAAFGKHPAAGGKKRHQLSSPGLSLLDSPDSGGDVLASGDGEASGSGKSFFTSRARAAATVQISKNVTLSASYGEISLRRGSSSGLKKNIGGTAVLAGTTKLNSSPLTTSPMLRNMSSLSLSSDKSSKPKPTRFPGTPSPHKRKLANLKSDGLVSKENQCSSDVAEPASHGVRSSPRRKALMPINSSNLLLPATGRETTPKKASRLLDDENADPLGKRKCTPTKEGSTSASFSPRRRAPSSSSNSTPTKKDRDLSPRRLVLSKSTPTKVVEVRVSPRKAAVLSPARIAQRNVVIEVVHQSPNSKSAMSPLRVQRSNGVASPLKTLQLSPQQSPNKANTRGSPGRLLLRNFPLRPQLGETSSAMECDDQSANVNDVSTESSISPFKRLKQNDVSKTSDTLSNGTPLKSKSTPSKANSTPSKSKDTPSKCNGTPSRSRNTPSKSSAATSECQSPSTLKLTPSKSIRASLSQAESIAESNGSSSSIESPRRSTSTRGTPLKDGVNDAPKVKYFPVFDPEKRRTHDKNGKQKSSRSSTGVRGPLGDHSQRVLDAGQRQFGATQCAQCGLVYEYGDPDDDLVHTAHHNRVMAALAYTNWKKERQVTGLDSRGGRCVLVTPSDPQYCWRKVREVLAVVDEELGFEDGNTDMTPPDRWVFLYVMEGKVSGCLVAERVNKAYRVVPGKDSSQEKERLKSSGGDPEDVQLLCCSTEPVAIKFGVSRIWVRSDARRMGLASKMVDAFRANLLPCVYLQLDDFAFSDPTPSGMKFAQSYTQKEDFLVYRLGA